VSARIYLTDKSSPNSRVYFLARETIPLPERLAREVNPSERIRRARRVLRCRLQPKMNRWRDTRVKKAIVIDFVVQIEVPKHLDSEVSEK
jgi:hypothetical protein